MTQVWIKHRRPRYRQVMILFTGNLNVDSPELEKYIKYTYKLCLAMQFYFIYSLYFT